MGGIPGEETGTVPKKGQTEEQIVAALRQVEAGVTGWGGLSQGRDQRGDLLPVEAAILRGGRERTA